MITLHGRCTAVTPLAGQVQIVGALATDMALTNVVLCGVSSCESREKGIAGKRARHARMKTFLGDAFAAKPYCVVAFQKRILTQAPRERPDFTYIELFSGRAALAAVLPLAHELVAWCTGRCGRGRILLSWSALRLLLWCRRGLRHGGLRWCVAHNGVGCGSFGWC